MRPARDTRRRRLILAVVLVLMVYAARRPLLRAVGEWLIDADASAPADVAVAMPETGDAGLIELADLVASGSVSRVVLMLPEPGPAERELRRRGVSLDAPDRMLLRLGVEASRIATFDAGEGGTTEGADALARWAVQSGAQRVLVVTSADHSHRLRRALGRALPSGRPRIALRVPAVDVFRAESWWHERRTLRSGLVELQKLLMDVGRHPLSSW